MNTQEIIQNHPSRHLKWIIAAVIWFVGLSVMAVLFRVAWIDILALLHWFVLTVAVIVGIIFVLPFWLARRIWPAHRKLVNWLYAGYCVFALIFCVLYLGLLMASWMAN